MTSPKFEGCIGKMSQFLNYFRQYLQMVSEVYALLCSYLHFWDTLIYSIVYYNTQTGDIK